MFLLVMLFQITYMKLKHTKILCVCVCVCSVTALQLIQVLQCVRVCDFCFYISSLIFYFISKRQIIEILLIKESIIN